MTRKLLRTIILSTVLCLTSFVSKAQWVSIPDSNFGTWLNENGFDACLQGNNALGWQMDTVCIGGLGFTDIDCSLSFSITDLTGISYFDGLENLSCSDNQLTTLPPLPSSLKILQCGNNPITTLPTLPSGLTELDCGYTQLTSLPTLPNSLLSLTVSAIQIQHLPMLPPNLQYLYCFVGQLLDLPTLPASLKNLLCPLNQLTTLPELPTGLTRLQVQGNQLTSLPALPDSLWEFDCSYNRNLACFPELKRIFNFIFDSTGIICLPNYGNVTYSSPSLASIPPCNAFNTNSCSLYWNINGKIYNDTSDNCTKDINETILQAFKVKLYQNGVLAQQNYSGGYGIYSFDTDMGTYTISVDTTGVPFDILCPASRFDTSVITALDSFDYDKDFALQCKPGFDVGSWSLVGAGFRPAHTSAVNIHAGDWAEFWGQNCNTNNLSGQVVTTISGDATYISAAAGALSPAVSGNTLTYNISNWSSVNPNTDFNIIVQTDTTAVLGSQICFDVNVTPTAGDNNVSNNHLLHCFTVVGSYDPNEKEVSPVNNVSAGDWLTYTIHFQNTGTASAEHIYVTDTLDSNIDAGSFQLLAYSHQPMAQLKGNNLRFNFPNTNLPDSNTNEALSHGYVQYRVKLKNNLQLGTPISNTAFIYFDFNSPVVTNTTSNTITATAGIEDFEFWKADFGLNPNPASESVRISVDESMIGGDLSIMDITGRRLITVSVANSTFSISTAAFSSGVYFVRIGNAIVSGTKKILVKQQ